jgi:hypothetical protein
MTDPGGHRVRGHQPGQRVPRQWLRARHQDQVAEPPAAQHARLGDEAHLREDRAHRRDLRPDVRQRRPVGHVGGVDAAGAQHPAGRRHKLRGVQVGRRPAAREHVSDHHVAGAGPQPLQHRPRVPDPDPDPAHRQPEPDQLGQRRVDLDGHLNRARPGRRHVPGQGQSPGSQVQHPQRLPSGRRRIDHVAEPPDVLEVQVARVVQVNVRLRHAVDQQHPRRRPVGVPQQLGATVGSRHDAVRVPCRALCHSGKYGR